MSIPERALHNYGMMGIVAEVLNLDYKPVSVMCKKGHHPQNVQRPREYVEKLEAETILRILKGIVAKYLNQEMDNG